MMKDMTRGGDGAVDRDVHLTEDELDEVLMEIAEPALMRHAEGCRACAERLEEFRDSMSAFNSATLAGAATRSSRMPVPEVRTGVLHWLQQGLRTNAGWACAGAATVVLVAGALHEQGATSAQGTASLGGSDYSSSRQQEISNDNAMLSDISAELYQPVAIPEMLFQEKFQGRRGEHSLKQVRN